MSIIEAIILGIVQGITEFLPISSSGHLVIIPYLLTWEIPPIEAFIFDVLVQVATLIEVKNTVSWRLFDLTFKVWHQVKAVQMGFECFPIGFVTI